MYNTTHHKILLLLITHTHTHTHTHTQINFFFLFAVLRKLNNVYSVLTVARLGHSSCGNLPLGATVKRESGKTQHAEDGFPVCSITQSCPALCNPRTVANQAHLSMGFSRQEYWTGLPCPPPGVLPNPRIESASPALAGGLFATEPPGKPEGVPWIRIVILRYKSCSLSWRSLL